MIALLVFVAPRLEELSFKDNQLAGMVPNKFDCTLGLWDLWIHYAEVTCSRTIFLVTISLTHELVDNIAR